MKNEIKLGKTVDSIAERFNLNIYQEYALIQLSKEMKNQNKNYKYSEKQKTNSNDNIQKYKKTNIENKSQNMNNSFSDKEINSINNFETKSETLNDCSKKEHIDNNEINNNDSNSKIHAINKMDFINTEENETINEIKNEKN